MGRWGEGEMVSPKRAEEHDQRSGATRYSNESCRAEHAERAASGGDGETRGQGDRW